ncbi:MAG: aminopeptidase P family protein, partial [Nitriliruptorales bacterium]
PLDLADRRLPGVDHRARRDRVRDALAAEGLDAVYVTTPTNVRWLTGFTGSNGQLLLAVDPDLDVFLTDGRYATESAEQVPDLGDHFLHGTGHGVGLDIHERPTVAAGASVTLRARMTVTVEPGGPPRRQGRRPHRGHHRRTARRATRAADRLDA